MFVRLVDQATGNEVCHLPLENFPSAQSVALVGSLRKVAATGMWKFSAAQQGTWSRDVHEMLNKLKQIDLRCRPVALPRPGLEKVDSARMASSVRMTIQ
jgi:hypothetical protein